MGNSCTKSSNVGKCQSINRLMELLHFYQAIEGDTNNDKETIKLSLLEYIDEYKHLLNDYCHILHVHLSNTTKQENDANFSFISNKYCKYINCSINECKHYERNNRDRCREIITDKNEDDLFKTYIDIIDTIHCYFLHSYDTGFRVRTTTKIQNNETKENDDDDDSDLVQDNDEEMKYLGKEIKSTRNKLRKIGGLQRIEKTKFIIDVGVSNAGNQDTRNYVTNSNNNNTVLDDLVSHLANNELAKSSLIKLYNFILSNEYDSESLKQDLSESKQSNLWKYFNKSSDTKYYDIIEKHMNGSNDNSNFAEYSFGQKFYYDDEDKDNDKEDISINDEINHNPGYKIKDWYVFKKYDNLKQEIIENKLFKLKINEYNAAYNKSELFSKATGIRDIIAQNLKWTPSFCYPKKEKTMRVEHVLSVVLYTDYTDLSYNYSQSFRKLNDKENNQEFKQRKREFYHWSKILINTVESFGTIMYHNKIDIFYTGISSPVIFNSFIANFYGPTSTTAQISVATIFATNSGIILELQQTYHQGTNLKYFDCSLFSCFGNEDERLFINGYAPLQFNSIRFMDDNKNYMIYISSMKKFNMILNGQQDSKHRCKKIDAKIIDKLIKHQLKDEYQNAFPVYINNIFRQFTINRKYVKIDMNFYLYHISRNNPQKYILFSKCLFSTTCKSLLNFSFLSSLFKQCTEISMKSHCKEDSASKITSIYLSLFLKEIENINIDKTNSLKTIKLIQFTVDVTNEDLTEFKNSLNALNWDVVWATNYLSIHKQ